MKNCNRVYPLLARDAARLGGLHLWLVFRCLPTVVVASLLFLLLLSAAPSRAALTLVQQGQVPDLNGVESPQLLLQDQATGHYTAALMHASKVHFDISGLIATVAVEQSFRNDTDRWLEGVYAFPLPDRAAVRYLEMVVGERRIVGKVRERAVAKKIYEQAKKAGKKASLVEQQRPNLFTNRVANIGPGEEITVRLEYVEEVAFDAGLFSLRFPTTITPRYMPGTPLDGATDPLEEVLAVNPALGWARPTDQVPDADAISPYLIPSAGSDTAPHNPIEITASLDMGMPLASVTSPYHDIALARRAGVYAIRLANRVSEMDRDFVLNWQPVTGSVPGAALFTEQVAGEYFGLLMVVPPGAGSPAAGSPAAGSPAAGSPAAGSPAAGQGVSVIPREIIIVVDTSGSMGGVSIEQARASVSRALQQLRPQDRFNIIEFNSNHRSLYRTPMPADRHHVQKAQEFVRQLRASGGTEMLPALQAALAPQRQADEYSDQPLLRQVIFITDGAVGNEVALFEEIAGRLGDNRLFTVGIGSAPNSWFMRKAAQFGRGSHTHIGDLNEVGEKMAALFEHLARPVAVNMSVKWPLGVEAWPERLPDLYQGQPLSLTVSFGNTPPQGEVVVSGQINGRTWSKRLQLAAWEDPASAAQHRGVASLWARFKIAGLLDQKVAGRDEEAVRAEVLPVALQHQLLSPYTSFIAVEEAISRPPQEGMESKAVANTRPRGQAPQAFAYPRTATTGPARAWFGALVLFIALIVHTLRQPEVDHVPSAAS